MCPLFYFFFFGIYGTSPHFCYYHPAHLKVHPSHSFWACGASRHKPNEIPEPNGDDDLLMIRPKLVHARLGQYRRALLAH